MFNSEFSAVIYGLASAATWGTGDFCGGAASKKSNTYMVVIVSQIIGGALLLLLALLFGEPFPGIGAMLWGAMAGFAACLALVSFYQGLAMGRMGIIAPLTAIVAAGVPVIVSFALEGLPEPTQLTGFVLALAAVWWISRDGEGGTFRVKDLALPLFAGICFGIFFIGIDQVSEDAVFWPLVAARITSLTFLLLLTHFTGRGEFPQRRHLPLIAMTGTFDSVGNAFFALATQAGRLDISTVVASLYPAITVILAYFVLREAVTWRQWLGLGLALVAVVMIAG